MKGTQKRLTVQSSGQTQGVYEISATVLLISMIAAPYARVSGILRGKPGGVRGREDGKHVHGSLGTRVKKRRGWLHCQNFTVVSL